MESDEQKIARLESELAEERQRNRSFNGRILELKPYKEMYEDLLDKTLDKLIDKIS